MDEISVISTACSILPSNRCAGSHRTSQQNGMMSFQVCKVLCKKGHKNDAGESIKVLAETIKQKAQSRLSLAVT